MSPYLKNLELIEIQDLLLDLVWNLEDLTAADVNQILRYLR